MTGRISTKPPIHRWLLPLLLALIFMFQHVVVFTNFFEAMELSHSMGTFLQRPWSILSYAFLHSSYLHLGINIGMLILIVLGRNMTEGEMWCLFVVAVVVGGGVFILVPVAIEASIVGASAGICALISVSIYRFFLNRKLWVIVLPAVILLDLLTHGLQFSLGFSVHISGYCIGLLYALLKDYKVVHDEVEAED